MNKNQQLWIQIGLFIVSSSILLFFGKAGLGLGTKIESLAPIRFNNAAASAGLNFVLENHPTPQKHLIEAMPGGVAAFDYDGDGLTDIYFANGAAIPSLEKESPKYFNRLYRNQSGMKFAAPISDHRTARRDRSRPAFQPRVSLDPPSANFQGR